MRPDQEIRFVVDDLDPDGAGVGTVGATWDVHVPGALPGEEISARVNNLSTHRPTAWASLNTIHQPSSERVAPTCLAHGRCGGCVLQHYDIAAQVRWKESRLRQLVGGAVPALGDVSFHPMVTSPKTIGYRNNAKLVPAQTPAGAVILGGYARRSHQIVDLAGCSITEPALESVAMTLREILRTEAVDPYDEVRLTGLLRHVVLRANADGHVLVTLVTATEFFAAGARVADRLRAARPNVVGVIHNVNTTRGNAIYGPHESTLAGASVIEDRIGSVRLRLSSRAFFQANRDVAREAYDAIARAVVVTRADHVVDAYAGVGGIALTLAASAGSVVGIEDYAGAVRDADANAALNDIGNARFVAGDVARGVSAIDAADIVVLNPPRKGCGAPVLRQIAALGARTIAYLSCAPETLVRDLAILAELGYRTTDLTPFDMLPHTPHIETLAILRR